jgi:hypothetical protein
MAAINAELFRRLKETFDRTAFAMRDSILVGSAVTGAPGQPVDTSTLKKSWRFRRPEKFKATMGTKLVYAPIVENAGLATASGRSGAQSGSRYTLRSKVGGFHSVKLTYANFGRLVDEAAKEVGT